jgi:cobalt-zinc-cadmium efflux system membrane fusion protein
MPRSTSILALALLPVLAACGHAAAAASSEPQPPAGEVWLSTAQAGQAKVRVEVVAEQPVDDAIVTSGRVTFDDLKVAHIYSPVTGRVTRMDAALGQRVKKGAALATIVSPDIGQTSSDLGKADADLIAAEHGYNRKKELYESHACSAADFETAEDTYRQAKAEKSRAQQKAALLRAGSVDLVTQGYTLTTPIDGEVIARSVSPGIEVQGQYANGSASELFTVGELDKVWVLADVYENDLARVAVGAKVTVTAIAYPNKTFTGTVDWVSGTLDPNTRTARVRCTFDNPDRLLKPEMYSTVRIAVQERRALAVPRTSIVHLGDQSVVFVEMGTGEKGQLKYERLPVTADEALDGPYVPVSHGIEKGMKIVVDGAPALANLM